MPQVSIFVVDVIWEFHTSKQHKISIEAASDNRCVQKQNRTNQKQIVASAFKVI